MPGKEFPNRNRYGSRPVEDTARLDQGTQSSAVREPGVRQCRHRLKRSRKRIPRASCVGGVVWIFCETTGSHGRIFRIK